MNLQPLIQSASDALAKGQLEQAYKLCRQILDQQPRHPEAHYLLAMIALQRNLISKAIALLQAATRLKPEEGRYWTQLTRAYSQANNFNGTQQALQRTLELDPTDAMSVDTLGVLLSRLGNHPQAEDYFQRSLQRQPDNTDYLYNLATSLRINGKLDQAVKYYFKLYRLQADRYEIYPAIAELAATEQCPQLQEEFEQAFTLLDHQNTVTASPESVNNQLRVSHGLARLFERQNKATAALDTLIKGNRLKRQALNYSSEYDSSLFEAIKTICNQDFYPSNSDYSSDSSRPIFIIGMPRSGTTLLERIISSHTQVSSAGELQEFPTSFKRLSGSNTASILDLDTLLAAKQINFSELGGRYLSLTKSRSGEKLHFIDKMPLNFLYAGFIHKALPNAKIICLRRNPMDTVVSNFRQLFATKFSYYNYAYDLEDIARYYLLFDKLISHWRQTLPSSHFCEVHYESLVDDTEQQAQQIIKFLNLPWQQQCLDFHNNEAPVATASAIQVRQPIYRSSLGRWKKLESQLSSVKQIFDQANLDYK
jgi:tetratricopeptide (TPR) repeat protein